MDRPTLWQTTLKRPLIPVDKPCCLQSTYIQFFKPLHMRRLGKTIAFLLPALQRILNEKPNHNQINMLIISPTRELTQQIGEQTRLLTQNHNNKDFSYQVMVGGTSKPKDINAMKRSIPSKSDTHFNCKKENFIEQTSHMRCNSSIVLPSCSRFNTRSSPGPH
jgi:hypothetical protein